MPRIHSLLPKAVREVSQAVESNNAMSQDPPANLKEGHGEHGDHDDDRYPGTGDFQHGHAFL